MIKEWYFGENKKFINYACLDATCDKNEFILSTEYKDGVFLKRHLNATEAKMLLKAKNPSVIDYLY